MNSNIRITLVLVIKLVALLASRILLAKVIFAAMEAMENKAERERLAKQFEVQNVCDLLDDDPEVRRAARIALGRPADEDESTRQAIAWAESLRPRAYWTYGRPDTSGMTSVTLDEV